MQEFGLLTYLVDFDNGVVNGDHPIQDRLKEEERPKYCSILPFRILPFRPEDFFQRKPEIIHIWRRVVLNLTDNGAYFLDYNPTIVVTFHIGGIIFDACHRRQGSVLKIQYPIDLWFASSVNGGDLAKESRKPARSDHEVFPLDRGALCHREGNDQSPYCPVQVGQHDIFLVVAVLRIVKGIVEGNVKVELANLREQAIGVVADTYI